MNHPSKSVAHVLPFANAKVLLEPDEPDEPGDEGAVASTSSSDHAKVSAGPAGRLKKHLYQHPEY